MRTAGMLLMDTPLPDGRLVVLPQDFLGATTSAIGSGTAAINITGALIGYQAFVPGMMTRYGMSDDAQAQFGMANPSGGFQGAQAQPISALTPFTTPYGPTGRPPFASASLMKQPVPRPKGLRPKALTMVYAVTGGSLTSFQAGLRKTVFNVGQAPVVTDLLVPSNFSLNASAMQCITIPVPPANQVWLGEPFTILSVNIAVNAGAATASIYGAFIDVDFNNN